MGRPSESGSIKKQWGSAIPVAVVYPNVYRVGMGNLGFQFLYGALNADSRFLAERFFLPEAPRGPKARQTALLSEESGRPLGGFFLIAFTLPFENDYPTVPRMLEAAGIAPLQKDRGPTAPLVMAGGVSVSMNPEPLAPFLDLVFVGELVRRDDSSDLLDSLAGVMEGFPAARAGREEILAELSSTPGVYIPSGYSFHYGADGLIREIEPHHGFPTRVSSVKGRGTDAVVPVSVMFTPEAEFGQTVLVEANRGCGRGCRFCATGWIHFPVRYAGFESFREAVDGAISRGQPVGLIGSDLAGHPDLDEILTYIIRQGGTFSLSSIRPEGLSLRIMELMAASGQKTATLAPEAASPRMKEVIGKRIASERFYTLVEKLVTAGIPNVRFYFMLGLPTETDADAAEIVSFVHSVREVFVDASRPRKKIGKIGIQLNPFVPKPWTPFQWVSTERPETLRARIRHVQEGLRGVPNVVVRVESVREAITQALLSRGDRRISAALLAAGSGQGRLLDLARAKGVDLLFFVHREREFSEILPWDVIDLGVTKAALWRTFRKAVGT